MNIALLNERITFQKNSVVVDSIGNHKNEWADYFTCSAYAAMPNRQQSEKQAAGVTVSDDNLNFTVRYCSELACIDNTHYRVVFRDENYNITSIDRMNYQNKSLKIVCTKERRNE
ncbi:MAG: phage head closure protein [Clostridiales bacterium]|nr:phage head closure protein [Clostridiales bacterium]